MVKKEAAESGNGQKSWRHGTLVYTFPGLIALFAWLLWGDFAWTMKDRAVGPSATLLIKGFGVSDFVYTLICVAFPNATNIILCPVVSYISDRHRGRLGRRIPFLIFTTPFIVAGLVGLGFTPMLGSWLYRTAGGGILSLELSRLIFFGIFWIVLDFGTTTAGAISTALINDVVPSALLGRFFALFRIVSLLAGMLFNFFLLGMVEEYSLYIFCGLGLIYGIGLCCLCCKVKEGAYPPPEPVPAASGVEKIFGPVLIYFRQSFSIAYYRWVILALVLSFLAPTIFNMFSILYAKSLAMDMNLYGKLLTVTYGISIAVSFSLGSLADRFHPLRATIAVQICLLLTFVAGAVFTRSYISFAVVLVLYGVVSGAFYTLVAPLGARLFPRKLFAQFNSAFAMLQAVCNMLLGPLLGLLLDRLGSNYLYTFGFAGVASLLAILSLWRVYVQFIRYGGDRDYAPPDPEA